MKRLAMFGALCAAGAPVSGAASQQFDLKCTGTQNLHNAGVKTNGPLTRVLHVDLDRREYCQDACTEIKKIQDINSLEITFEDVNNRGGALDTFISSEKVNRQTGDYERVLIDISRFQTGSARATCEPAPFTPFPTTKF
jgi:hypothetical protein